MRLVPYSVISTTTEDSFGEVDTFDDALRIAPTAAHDVPAGEPVAIEHRGRVIRQLTLTPDGRVTEEEIR